MILKHNLMIYIIGFVLFAGTLSCSNVTENESAGTDAEIFMNVTEDAELNRVEDSYSHCWGDINGDDLPDIFIINHISSPLLFKNNGDGTFTDITSAGGVKRGGDLHGCAIADYDNDGDQDIYITSGSQKGEGIGLNRLYENNGKGQFRDVAVDAGVADPKGRGRSAAWADYNNDGFLDLFVANNKRNDAPAVLFKNNHNRSFSDVTAESGLDIVDNMVEVSWIDFNSDGYMDLTIAVYRKHLKGKIIIYKNMGHGSFKEINSLDGRSYVWGDYDNDGDMDLIISNPPRTHILNYEIGILSKIFRGFIKLYENDGEGHFRDVSGRSGFKGRMGGEKAVFFDYDNDGDQDVYLLVSGTLNKNINDVVFRNNGDKTFTDITKTLGLNQSFAGRGSGVAFADYNNDGFLDLFITNGKAREPYVPGKEPGPYVLYENRGNSMHWLKIKLIGMKSNRDGIGARVRLQYGSQWQYRQNNGGMEGYIQNSRLIHFGLGKENSADRIEVLWPGGLVTDISNVRADQILVIREK